VGIIVALAVVAMVAAVGLVSSPPERPPITEGPIGGGEDSSPGAPVSWTKITIPWEEGFTLEAWILDVTVPGEIHEKFNGASVGIQVDGEFLPGWWNEDWTVFAEKGAVLLSDWSGLRLSAGARLVVLKTNSWTVPEDPPELDFVPDGPS